MEKEDNDNNYKSKKDRGKEEEKQEEKWKMNSKVMRKTQCLWRICDRDTHCK